MLFLLTQKIFKSDLLLSIPATKAQQNCIFLLPQ